MVQLTRIYTKGGDKGKTSLGIGKRVSKSSLRIAAIGDVDEANACIGVARVSAGSELSPHLGRVQNDLFDVGADLCVPERGKKDKERLRLESSQVTYLESYIDEYNQTLPPLTSFILPGGTALAAALHHARTVVRRAERSVCALNEQAAINPHLIAYLNRLSDLLFVFARYVNLQEGGDILWVPGANR